MEREGGYVCVCVCVCVFVCVSEIERDQNVHRNTPAFTFR